MFYPFKWFFIISVFIISRNCSAHEFAAKGKTVLPIRELQRFKFFQSQQNIVKAYNSEICTAEFRCGTAKNRIFGFFRFDEQFIIAGSCGNFFQDVEFFCDGTGFNDSAVFTAECRGAAVIDKLNKRINAFFNYPFLLNQNMYPFQRLSVVHSFKNPIFGIRHKILNADIDIHKLPDKA